MVFFCWWFATLLVLGLGCFVGLNLLLSVVWFARVFVGAVWFVCGWFEFLPYGCLVVCVWWFGWLAISFAIGSQGSNIVLVVWVLWAIGCEWVSYVAVRVGLAFSGFFCDTGLVFLVCVFVCGLCLLWLR